MNPFFQNTCFDIVTVFFRKNRLAIKNNESSIQNRLNEIRIKKNTAAVYILVHEAVFFADNYPLNLF